MKESNLYHRNLTKMKLLIIRHAEAVAQGDKSDHDRELTDLGCLQSEHLSQFLMKNHIQLDMLVSSPYERAKQTAEILKKSLGLSEEKLLFCRDFEPNNRRKRMARCVNSLEGETFAVIGHEPDLSSFIGWLCGNKKCRPELVKGGLALVEVEGLARRGAGILKWLLVPELYK